MLELALISKCLSGIRSRVIATRNSQGCVQCICQFETEHNKA